MWLNNHGQIKRRLEVAKLWIVSRARLRGFYPPSSGTPRPRIAFWKPCLGSTIMKAITCAMCRGTRAGCVRRTDSALSRAQEQACVERTPLKPLPVWSLQRLDLLPQHKHARVSSSFSSKGLRHGNQSRATQKEAKADEISWDTSNSFFHFISLGQQIRI